MSRNIKFTNTETAAKSAEWEKVTVGEVLEAIDVFTQATDPDYRVGYSELHKSLSAWATVIANARKGAE